MNEIIHCFDYGEKINNFFFKQNIEEKYLRTHTQRSMICM